ncbi:hypothetical protein CVD25_10130 [Bacillus canaveralius]|uniref:Uncharacterized protein n=1 Tax=Bacillus canaveralius TaxID=1403243 RepID=A0A2N5GMB8_9BACI|nr:MULTISPECIES: hypothetical protein [Bacillus]PLR83007.1 hypothetical protein CU635_11070 [Bacillus canaveralius]PLR87933.1 hypothetical protein CVD23_00325 [Bacillus sp. V33-4]PLR96989.1 hypothetical protein CVD25_10130 [Bacillus canaveralius]RSK47916.1 hypothetical protein EJA13_17725 [Bacillus canaveralius]
MWVIKTEHKRDHGGTAALELESEDGKWDVNARWDGCMEIHVYSITEENRELKDTFHTCDLNGFIDKLQSLNGVLSEFFGDEESYWESMRQS